MTKNIWTLVAPITMVKLLQRKIPISSLMEHHFQSLLQKLDSRSRPEDHAPPDSGLTPSDLYWDEWYRRSDTHCAPSHMISSHQEGQLSRKSRTLAVRREARRHLKLSSHMYAYGAYFLSSSRILARIQGHWTKRNPGRNFARDLCIKLAVYLLLSLISISLFEIV